MHPSIASRTLRLALPALWLLALSAPVLADESWRAVTLQNDLLMGNDGGGYTNGLYVSGLRWRSASDTPLATPLLLRPLMQALQLPPPTLAAWSFGQTMVTPSDITRVEPDPRDAPYVGALMLRSSYVAVREAQVSMLALNIGVIGPLSGAKSTQRFVHKLTDSTAPRGWDSQGPNRLLIGLEAAHGWRARWKSDHGSAHQDAIVIGHGALGNLQSSVGATLLLRHGHGLDRSYATTPRVLSARGDPMATGRGWFVFLALSADRLFLHEGVERHAVQRATLRENAYRAGAGLAYGWRRSSLTLSVQRGSPLVDAGKAESYASIQYGWRLP